AAPVHPREAAVMQEPGDGSQELGVRSQEPGARDVRPKILAPDSKLLRHERLVPIDLQIGPDADMMVPRREDAGQIDHHRLVFARREADATSRGPATLRVA